jgi:hypothetical protein
MDQEMKRPMTEAEERRYKAGIPMETIAEERMWKKRPDGLAIKMPTPETVGEFVITGQKRSGNLIYVHKIGTGTNTWPKDGR